MNQERMYNILLGAHISEKSTVIGDTANQFAFKVAKDANDAQAREDAALLLSLAWAKDAITQDDVVSGLATHLAGYKDFKAYDLPKVDVYLGVVRDALARCPCVHWRWDDDSRTF